MAYTDAATTTITAASRPKDQWGLVNDQAQKYANADDLLLIRRREKMVFYSNNSLLLTMIMMSLQLKEIP